ncbi:MAG TPA: ATP-binding protein [Stellaceae bacterium]|nr:ATP-binding protein [Stellaceae bacterium]
MQIGAAQSRPGTLRPLKLLLAAVIVVPLALFGGAAWLNYRWSLEEAQAQLTRTTDAVHEHALKVFQTNELALDRIAERFGELDWRQIATDPAVHAYLKHLAGDVPHAAVLGFIAPDGRVVATNLELPPVPAKRHDFLRVPRGDDDDLFISELTIGNYTQHLQFLFIRYKPNSERTADGGYILVSMRPEYFRAYYDAAFGKDYAISIIRADGGILARYPELQLGTVLAPDTGYRQAIAANPDHGEYRTHSAVDGAERLFSYAKLGDYPVYVAVGIDSATVTRRWLDKMASHLVFGAPATLGLIILTIVALRRTARERAALLQANAEARRREELEASLYQAQKMEAVGQLTGGVAHDFNNLLTAIMGGLDTMLQSGSLPHSLRKQVAGAMRAAERGARLTQQLLAFSRQQMLHPEVVEVNRLLREFETLMRRAVGESIEFSVALDRDVDACRIDPAQFQSAILNLVVNARDATPAGGRVTLATSRLVLAKDAAPPDPEMAPGRYVVVSVGDTGTGMTADVRAQAFNPFFTTKEVGKGSGLGLSQVYGFTKQSGGHITIDSAPGRGTTVRLYMPGVAAPVEHAAVATGERAAPPASAGSVLIVEDDEAVRETARQSLAALGYRTPTAVDAAAALAILRRGEPIDLLFTDIVMPGGMSGVELAHEARRLRGDLKVLLTTGYAAVAESRADEDFAVLSKPYRQNELAERIAALLNCPTTEPPL